MKQSNKTQEALKMAIEAIEYNLEWYNIGDEGIDKSEQAIQACKEALAEGDKQEWQSLSDDDMEKAKFYDESFYNGARWAEQVLKEKNHG